ncbi:S-layer homology domain-containing protein [Agathobaculum sp.]|uniref:S-layer homology domain-containing protein n=1 Tax=Agathobaculum sp. TaxID=2048138 RepID=UPI003AB6BBA3
MAEAIPEKEQAVIRPKDITEGITGQEVKAQKLWALSHEDSIFLYRNSCTYAAKWWTRSSNEVYGYGSWTIHPDGKSGSALNVDYDAAVRPAMELDLSSVLFISAAEHGKVADLTTPIAEYAGDEWKLTLHDSDRDDFTAKTVLVNGSVLEVEYKNAKVGDNEYISAVIKDADGSISRYTRVVQLDGTTNGTRGRAAIDLTGIDMTGKTLCVFNEQFNGNHKTDYAGALREVKLTDEIGEQFTLAPGDTYYFDLSAMGIPGTANSGNSDGAVSLPDTSLHYVPFTYAGTVDAYKLTSEKATTEEYAQKNKYPHSLFVADYAVTHTVSWNDLDTASLIFGKNYASGGVNYTLRAPSVGSNSTGSDESQRGTPQSNEWDRILDKDSGYIKNWSDMSSLGQDTRPDNSNPFRAVRGYPWARYWNYINAMSSYSYFGFRPVLEVLNPDTLGSGGLKAVTLNLGGGKLGGSTDTIQIIVKTGSKFTAPASNGLTRPDGNNGSYFKWLGSDGNLYAPGESVPAVVTTLTAQWTVNQYTITYDLAGGTAEGNPSTYTIETVAFTLKNPTKSGYTFTGWSGTGLDGENNMTVTIPTGSTGNRTYTAHWRYNGSGHSYSYYTIKATAGAGGSISPSGNVSVREGRDRTFTITPDKGYAISNVKIDGKSIGAVKSYTFENVRRNHAIEVIFTKTNGNPQTGVFVDVATGSYYEDAVDWAVENGITKGTDDTHFSPDGICTRAQAVTFLWRTAGSPASKTSTMPFTDVPVGSYYYDAVLWAVENGITKGTSDTTFSPNMTCTRAQIVAFLWRSEKSPAAGTANPFADVKSTAYYADAVLWAVKENITKGTTSTTFSPNADCTRAQIVTFLWRCKK